MSRPNLLFIFTDEQRADSLGACGSRWIRTPRLDGLASQSVLFENAYVTQSVCTPSRCSILTGLWPHSSGCIANNVPLPPSVATIAEMMDRRDTAFGYHGKWHLGDEVIAQHGFDDWVSIEDEYWQYVSRAEYGSLTSDYCRFLVSQGIEPDRWRNGGKTPWYSRSFTARLPEELGKPAFLARSASRFLEENRSRRFVLFVNFLEPHMPFFGPRDHMYSPADAELPANFNDPVPADAPLRNRLIAERFRRHGHGSQRLDDEADWRRLIARYGGLVSLVDAHVGTILDTLARCGLEDRTIVVFTSDHGDMMGSHRLLAKTVQYEEALKVPLVMRVPGVAPRRVRERVSQIDLVPTLLDLLGEGLPGGLQGGSLAGFIRGREPLADEGVFAEWNGPDGDPEEPPDGYVRGARIRTVIDPAGWKLNWSEIGEHELFNLAADPLETRNLCRRPEHRATVERLKDRIRAWQDQVGDEVALAW